MICRLNSDRVTVVFVELDDWNIVGVLSDFGDLIFKIKVVELSDVARFEVIDWFRVRERQKEED